jgi:hypothetical protein
MVYKNDSEGKKPRGRPFQKGHTIRRTKNTLNNASGHSISDEGGVVASSTESAIVEPVKDSVLYQLPKLVMDITDQTLKECMETTQLEKETDCTPSQEKESECVEITQKETSDTSPVTLIESMDFTNGENKLSIRFSKKNNRMFNIKILLNEENEIRPVTYNGSGTAYGFWNLLKKSLKK